MRPKKSGFKEAKPSSLQKSESFAKLSVHEADVQSAVLRCSKKLVKLANAVRQRLSRESAKEHDIHELEKDQNSHQSTNLPIHQSTNPPIYQP